MACPLASQAQPSSLEAGQPFHVERYSPHDYGQNEQNWGIAQDARGTIFVANRNAVLEFDGTEWRSHAFPNDFARSIASAEDGVCVGGVGEFGCLEPDSAGDLVYRDLTHLLPEHERDFADVWTTHSLSDGVYFQSFRSVFRWDGRSLRSWHANGRFHKAFTAHDRYFVREEGRGLLTLERGALAIVPGGEQFAFERIDAMVPIGDAGILIVTRDRGKLMWNGVTYEPFLTEADAYLESRRVYQAVSLTESTFALTTFSGSVIILDQDGRVITFLGANIGLQEDEMVLDVFQDGQGGLWLALDTGILRVDAPTPLTQFDGSLGIEGIVYDAYRHDGDLYVGTSQGLFVLQRPDQHAPIDLRQAHFRRVDGINQQVWHTLQAVDRLLVATTEGVFQVVGGHASRILDASAFFLVESRRRPGSVYVGLKSGLGRLQRTPSGWDAELLISGDEIGDVRVIRELEHGGLLVVTFPHGLVRVGMKDGAITNLVQHGDEMVSAGSIKSVAHLGSDEHAVLANDGIYRIVDLERLTLERDEAFDAVVDFVHEAGYLLSVAPSGELWMINRGRVRHFRPQQNELVDITPPVLVSPDLPPRLLMIEEDGVVWIGGQVGLLRYDPHVQKDYGRSFTAMVRSVTGQGNNHIYGGAGKSRFAGPELNYEANSLRFSVAAPSFNNSAATVFQFWLEGFDAGWSEWSHERSKEYTNLPEGRYRFHVRARNAQGVLSEIDTFAFTVLPPWYRSWWAYLMYVLASAVVIWGYGRWRLRHHLSEMERERQVREELEVANARLVQANERLHEADQLKDDVLANVSHELRTPLTSILGFAAVLIEELLGEKRTFAEHIHHSGKRLLHTVDTLLDMARLQADTMEIETEDIDLAAAVSEIARALEPAARAKNLYLSVQPENFVLPARTDPAAVDRILTNLIGNAIKFTDEGGVTVLVDADGDNVYVTVRDTGIGIREEFLPHLFGEFKQASAGYGRSHEGTGLGLAVTSRLVQLLEGEIHAESRKGGGTAFVVRLPRQLDKRSIGKGLPMKSLHLSDRRLMIIIDPSRQEYALRSALSSLAEVAVVPGIDEGHLRLRREEFDVVLIDGNLDGVYDGDGLARLRLEPGASAAAFVAVTAATMPGDRERFKDLGFDEHIGKPFTRSRLLTILDALLHRPKVSV